jgi:hypothetical protein
VEVAPVVITVVLGVWFLLSVLGQFDARVVSRIRSHDHFSLIPRWTFFAPRPGVTDYHLVYQTFLNDQPGPWREEVLADPRTFVGALWNPQKRNRKALVDSVRAFVRMGRGLEPDALWRLQYTIPYIAVLSYLTDITASEPRTHLRFMILESDGYYAERAPRLLFRSTRHAAC